MTAYGPLTENLTAKATPTPGGPQPADAKAVLFRLGNRDFALTLAEAAKARDELDAAITAWVTR